MRNPSGIEKRVAAAPRLWDDSRRRRVFAYAASPTPRFLTARGVATLYRGAASPRSIVAPRRRAPRTSVGRGDAADAARIFRGGASRRPHGCHVDIPRVAAPPRAAARGHSRNNRRANVLSTRLAHRRGHGRRGRRRRSGGCRRRHRRRSGRRYLGSGLEKDEGGAARRNDLGGIRSVDERSRLGFAPQTGICGDVAATGIVCTTWPRRGVVCPPKLLVCPPRLLVCPSRLRERVKTNNVPRRRAPVRS